MGPGLVNFWLHQAVRRRYGTFKSHNFYIMWHMLQEQVLAFVGGAGAFAQSIWVLLGAWR